MPGPRLARNLPTGVSSPSEASSSTRLSPSRMAAASTPCASTVSRLRLLGRFNRGRLDRNDQTDRVAGARLGLEIREQREHLVADEGLLLQEALREAVESGAMLGDQAHGLEVRVVGETRLLV